MPSYGCRFPAMIADWCVAVPTLSQPNNWTSFLVYFYKTNCSTRARTTCTVPQAQEVGGGIARHHISGLPVRLRQPGAVDQPQQCSRCVLWP
jgi:hypothetical protein